MAEMIRVKDMIGEWTRAQIMDAAAQLGLSPVKSGTAWAFTEEESAAIIERLELPPEIKPKLFGAMYLHPAKNPRYVFCKIEGHEEMGKQPVLVSSRIGLRQMVGKRFCVEKIEDAAGGITWRHEWFQQHNI
jgi:isopentenyl diphosphate isomerase/L-lactate dehydrogenase-like FMN-dependent dehydrogenase